MEVACGALADRYDARQHDEQREKTSSQRLLGEETVGGASGPGAESFVQWIVSAQSSA